MITRGLISIGNIKTEFQVTGSRVKEDRVEIDLISTDEKNNPVTIGYIVFPINMAKTIAKHISGNITS